MKILSLLSLVLLLSSCNYIEERISEGSAKKAAKIKTLVTADVQTVPVPHDKNEDSADDPAVWIHPDTAMKSIVFGTDKKGGLVAYDLEGQELAYYPIGNVNNVDIRQHVVFGQDTVDLIACTNRTTHSIDVARVYPEGKLEFYKKAYLRSAVVDEVYGFCLYLSPISGKLYAYLNSKAGEVEQWELQSCLEHGVKGIIVRSFDVGSQTEGMVADDERTMMYLGMEEIGICKFNAEPDVDYHENVILRSKPNRNKYIVKDIEGLAIYKRSNCECYLIASSQGNYSYSVFDLMNDTRYLFSFRVGDNSQNEDFIDGVEETDGLEVVSVPLGDKYPLGMLVVQDGYNRDEQGNLLPQNFKYIDWQKIERLIH